MRRTATHTNHPKAHDSIISGLTEPEHLTGTCKLEIKMGNRREEKKQKWVLSGRLLCLHLSFLRAQKKSWDFSLVNTRVLFITRWMERMAAVSDMYGPGFPILSQLGFPSSPSSNSSSPLFP
jgi:hypothetical protein